MVNFYNKLLLFLTAYLLIIPSTSMLFSWHLFLHKSYTISKAHLELQDIGNILGNDLTVYQKNALLKTSIGFSPIKNIIWNKNKIADLLQKQRVFPESIRGENINFHVNQKEISQEEIEKKITEKYELSVKNNNFKITVPSSIIIPEFLDYDLEIVQGSNPGQKEAKLKYLGYPEEVMNIPYTVLKKIPVLIALKPLEAGQRVNMENVIKKEIFSEKNRDKFDVFPIGYEITRKIQEGEILNNLDIKKKIDVMSGDRVTFLYSNKNLSIESEVKAVESGSIGQVIRFRNNKNKYFYGELVSKSQAIFRIME